MAVIEKAFIFDHLHLLRMGKEDETETSIGLPHFPTPLYHSILHLIRFERLRFF